MKQGICLGILLWVVVRAAMHHLWHRWWRYDGRGNLGEQVNYWGRR